MNEVKISGKICNIKEVYTPSKKVVTSFGLNIYNGKDAEGNAKYEFLNCKMFDKVQAEPKSMVEVEGWLGVEEYKDKKYVVVYVKKISDLEKKQDETVVANDNLDDDILF